MSSWLPVLFSALRDRKKRPSSGLKTISLGGKGRWDYLGVDGAARRLYVPRNNHVQVVDLDKGALVGDILKVSTKVAHGVAVAPAQNLGFVTTGKDNVVVVFDLKTLKITTTIKTGSNPDGIIYDPASKHILAMNHSAGSITVIDPADLEKTATITVGGKLESAVADGAGMVFVCVEDKSEVVQIDSKANKVLARWSVEPGDGPTGLAIDTAHHRLFAGCGNQKMIVLDAKTGKILGTPAIGKGVDGAAFDPVLGVALECQRQGRNVERGQGDVRRQVRNDSDSQDVCRRQDNRHRSCQAPGFAPVQPSRRQRYQDVRNRCGRSVRTRVTG